MIPRSPTPLLVACLLASFGQGHAITIDDLSLAPYREDTGFASFDYGKSGMYVNEWSITKRDQQGRPLQVTDIQKWDSTLGRTPY